MHARQGDQIVIDTTTLDALRRHGEVIEVIGQGKREHYRIRWQDGHESIYFPGPGRPSGVGELTGPAVKTRSGRPGSTWAVWVLEVVGTGELLRHHHAPGVDHELARLRRVEGR